MCFLLTLAVLRTLYHHVDLELGKLSDGFCELPLMKSLSAEPTDEFFDFYSKEVLPVFKDATLNKEKLMDRIHTLQIGERILQYFLLQRQRFAQMLR